MQKFYFNECFPLDVGFENIADKFAITLNEFNVLLERKIGIERAIVTEKLPSKIQFGIEGTLQDAIEKIAKSDLKNLAFSLFIKYPIDDHFPIQEKLIEELFEHEYHLNIGGTAYNAFNLAVTFHSNGFLFTTATHTELMVDALTCRSKKIGFDIQVDSLFGEKNNTEYIAENVTARELSFKSLWDQLLATLGDCRYPPAFRREFEKLRLVEQKSIITAFQEAKDRNLASKFYPDTKLIKDVTPQNAKQTVYELRIHLPTALRVYFKESLDITLHTQ